MPAIDVTSLKFVVHRASTTAVAISHPWAPNKPKMPRLAATGGLDPCTGPLTCKRIGLCVLQVRQLQSRLRTLSMQIASGEKPACDALPGDSDAQRVPLVHAEKECCRAAPDLRTCARAGAEDTASVPQPSVDVDHLSEDELRRELKKARRPLCLSLRAYRCTPCACTAADACAPLGAGARGECATAEGAAGRAHPAQGRHGCAAGHGGLSRITCGHGAAFSIPAGSAHCENSFWKAGAAVQSCSASVSALCAGSVSVPCWPAHLEQTEQTNIAGGQV